MLIIRGLSDNSCICILCEWDEFKNLYYQRIYKNMQKPAFAFDFDESKIVDAEKLCEIGFIVYSIGKPLDAWFKDMSCVLQGGDHGGYTLVETQFEVESSNSGRQSTLALGYLIGDREESGIVEPKGDDHEDLVSYVSIVAEEVQDLERIFREAIESNSDQTW
ncbi:unnamed protein product [Trifolium pratense]|uniref:Uncharacterized protein n=1 Tax=Trifolium pratense TaxID=57577 RepID=A0ACB0IVB0_TRIPR|nr:unnamed protein product [Trifolium pratense]